MQPSWKRDLGGLSPRGLEIVEDLSGLTGRKSDRTPEQKLLELKPLKRIKALRDRSGLLSQGALPKRSELLLKMKSERPSPVPVMKRWDSSPQIAKEDRRGKFKASKSALIQHRNTAVLRARISAKMATQRNKHLLRSDMLNESRSFSSSKRRQYFVIHPHEDMGGKIPKLKTPESELRGAGGSGGKKQEHAGAAATPYMSMETSGASA